MLGQFVAGLLAGWVSATRRFAWLVIALAVLATVVAADYTANNLTLNTDSADLLSPDLPYRKTYRAFQDAFPQLGDDIVVVIDGATPDQTEDAAIALSAKLREQPKLFKSVFYPAGDQFFRRNGLLFLDIEALQDLADRLADAQPLISTLAEDMSLRGLFDVLGLAVADVAKGNESAAPLARVLAMMADTVEARLAGHATLLSWRELMTGKSTTRAERRQFIIVQPAIDYSTLSPSAVAIAAIRRTAADLALDPAHGVRVRLTGGVPIREDELKSVRDSVGLASLISLVLVTALVFIGLRSPKLVLATVVSLLMGLTWTAAYATVAVGSLNLISVAFAVLFIGLAVDFCIQFGLRYKEEVDIGLGHALALRHAAMSAGQAVSLAALCAAIGFFAFVPTDYLGLAELGIIAGGGMFIGLFSALTVLPAMLSLSPPRPAKRPPARRAAVAGGAFIIRHAGAICVVALIVGLAALALAPSARFDFDPINLRDPSTESVQTYLDLASDSDTSPYSINVLTPSLAVAVDLGHRLEALDEVANVVTAASFIPKDQEDKLSVIEDMALFMIPILGVSETKPPPTAAERRQATETFVGDLATLADAGANAAALVAPGQRLSAGLRRVMAAGDDALAGLEHALLANLPARLDALRLSLDAGPVTLDDLPADLRARYLTEDGRARIEVFPAERLDDRAALERFVGAVRGVAPNATDVSVLLLEGVKAVIGAFKQAGVVAIALISLLLMVVLRSIADTLLVLLPLVLAAVLTVALTVLLDMPFNFANIIALPLLFSLGVAFGIYLVLRYRQEGSVAGLIATSTPRAALFSALTTMASFGSLLISHHRGTASMGALLVICLVLALGCTLIVLPALLAWRDGRRQRKGA